ncbi:MAG TPA: beta-galactosidase [Clostridiales bacterium UBA8960]|nr:beta-galactosidase [Clostridiales bacterium UBA8960]
MRRIIALNDEWFYKPSFHETDITMRQPDTHFSQVRLPHTNVELPLHYFDESTYQFHSCYMRKLPSIDYAQKKVVCLHFEGVMTYAEIFVNGIRIGDHKGGYTPFTFDITSAMQPDDNWLVVHVDSTERADIPPFGFVIDYLTYGGIYREVELILKSESHLDHLRIETPINQRGDFEAHVSFEAHHLVTGHHRIIASLYDGQRLIMEESRPYDAQMPLRIEFVDLGAVRPWNIETPNLYRMVLKLFDDSSDSNEPIDSLETRFGFRTATFKVDGFYLNGTKIKLRGLNRHQAYPYVGYAMPKSAQFKDADLLKYDLGCNIVRSSHYPPSRHFLDRCDEIGLLVFNEIPGWQHIGDESWQAVAIENVKEMIMRDFNHPSIVVWGVRINESPDSDALYEQTNQVAHALDKTRATGGVRNFAGSHIFEDIYTYNDFIHRGDNIALEMPKRITKTKMPYLVTEHNGHMFPTKSFDSESRRIEHALRHARVLETAYATNEISGAIGWCMSDYNTHKDFGSGDHICYHGVLDMFRIPKYAAAVYASQTDNTPYMQVLSSMFVGDFDASVLGKIFVFTNCDFIRVYKNDHLIGTFKPDWDNFGHLPHPPIVIDDLIGNLIAENERFSAHDAAIIKKILLKFVEHGSKVPLIYKLQMAILFIKYKMRFSDAALLYGKYIASWGEKSTVFKYEGYKENQLCQTIRKDANARAMLSINMDQTELMEGDTYDVTRVVVKYTDAFDATLHYANLIAKVDVIGPIEVIGPSEFSLIGGARAFWIKTAGTRGKAIVKVSLENGEEASTEIMVL